VALGRTEGLRDIVGEDKPRVVSPPEGKPQLKLLASLLLTGERTRRRVLRILVLGPVVERTRLVWNVGKRRSLTHDCFVALHFGGEAMASFGR
jgi:hypothetical protein